MGRVFHHKEHIQPLLQQRVDTEEVGSENAPGLVPAEIAASWAGRAEEQDRYRPAGESTPVLAPIW